MKELESMLREHAIRYPAMEPADAVKLIYQNEFGGGHMIQNPQQCIKYLFREYEQVTGQGWEYCTESIGNGLRRVMLQGLNTKQYPLERLGQDFIQSAGEHRGDRSVFLQKLDVLRTLTSQGVFSFDPAQLEEYLDSYVASGCPAVSHSQTYRDLYHPAYRIILEKYIPKELL